MIQPYDMLLAHRHQLLIVLIILHVPISHIYLYFRNWMKYATQLSTGRSPKQMTCQRRMTRATGPITAQGKELAGGEWQRVATRQSLLQQRWRLTEPLCQISSATSTLAPIRPFWQGLPKHTVQSVSGTIFPCPPPLNGLFCAFVFRVPLFNFSFWSFFDFLYYVTTVCSSLRG